MTLTPFHTWRWFWTLAAILVVSPAASAQTPLSMMEKFEGRGRLLKREEWLVGTTTPSVSALTGGTPGIRLFGMMPGFVSDAFGLGGLDDDVPGDDPVAARVLARNPLDGPDSNALQLSIGKDNPYFDLRKPGDPGGVGYHRLYSQMQLADLGSTSICVGLQAVTPAGQQDGGLQNGPTVLTPGFAVFHDLGNGTALQGFVGQHIHTGNAGELNNNRLHCGVGLQCPLTILNPRPDQGFFLSVQALARYGYDGSLPTGQGSNWAIVPGIHYRINSNCWLSLGAMHNGLLTCSWQF